MNWLVRAEALMPEIFKAGAANADAKAMEEIAHFVTVLKKVPEHKLVRFAQERVPAHSVMRVIDLMVRSGMVKILVQDDRTGMRVFGPPNVSIQRPAPPDA